MCRLPSTQKRRLRKSTRPGLTLIELVVVLTILIALAGLLIPMLPSMLTRAHTSTMTTNCGESAKAILTYQQLYAAYPNNWDSLTTDTTGTVITYLAGGSAMPAGTFSGSTTGTGGNGEVTTLTLSPNEISALTGVGITQVQMMTTTPVDPTFNNYASALPTPVTIGGTGGITGLAGLDPTTGTTSTAYARCVTLNLPITGRYVVLGIGPRVSMVGKTIQTPPVHFGDQPVLNPEYGYQRFVAIFKVSDSAAPAFTQAQFVGVTPIHDTGMDDIDSHLQGWYQLGTGGS